MIPLLRHKVFIALAENAKKHHRVRKHSTKQSEKNKIKHSEKKENTKTIPVSVKNLRRVKKYREKKLSEEKAIKLRNALTKQINLNHLTKKELEERIHVLQAHLEIYKNKFENLTKKQQLELTKRENQERLGSLVLIEKQLHSVRSTLQPLVKSEKITASEEKKLEGVVDALMGKLLQKKKKIQRRIEEINAKTKEEK